MTKRVLILTASTGSGHNIAADVLDSYARQLPDIEEVRTIDVLELTSDLYRALFEDAYFRLVNVAPWLVGWSYDRNDRPFGLPEALSLLDQLNNTEVVKAIKDYRPDVVPARAGADVPTLLISAGAAGGAYTRTVVAQTLRMRNPFQAVVVCGRNQALEEHITSLVAAQAERYRVLRYTSDMPDLMRVATLFVGKPGGLTSSECMAGLLATTPPR